jgi:dephospho-CoA kinase
MAISVAEHSGGSNAGRATLCPGSYASDVKRILLTGMSGTGKSSVVRELVARGYKAVDTDDGWTEPQPDGRQMWREDAIQALLTTEDADVLFVAGCEENQAKFHAQFDHIVLLSAPLETLVERLATRSNNSYGKAPEELGRFLDDVETVEPLLRRVASHEVRTTVPVNEVVTTVLRLVDA